jgi:hypothetical protein
MHRYWNGLFALGLLAALPTAGAQPDPPPQKTEVQRDIDRQLKAFKHDATATKPSKHLRQSIHNATPEQYDEYRKLKKEAKGRYVNDPNDPRSPLHHDPFTAAGDDTGHYNPADGGWDHRADCAGRPHPELDPWCRTLSPSLGR